MFCFPSAIKQEQNTDKNVTALTQYFTVSICYTYLFGCHVWRGTCIHCSFHKVLSIISLISNQAKVSNLHHFISTKHDVFRLQQATMKQHQPQDWCHLPQGFGGIRLTFKSLWMNFLEWMYSTPLTICLKIERLSSFLSWVWFSLFWFIHNLRLLVEHSSIWMYRYFSVDSRTDLINEKNKTIKLRPESREISAVSRWAFSNTEVQPMVT